MKLILLSLQEKRLLFPDEDLFVSPLSYEGYSYCRKDIRLNSKFSYVYICFLFYVYAESQGLVMAEYKCSSFRKKMRCTNARCH